MSVKKNKNHKRKNLHIQIRPTVRQTTGVSATPIPQPPSGNETKTKLTIYLNKKDILEPPDINKATYVKSTFNGLLRIRLDPQNTEELLKQIDAKKRSADITVKMRDAVISARLDINSINEGILTCQFPRESARLFLMLVDAGKTGLILSGINKFTLTSYRIPPKPKADPKSSSGTDSASSGKSRPKKSLSAGWKTCWPSGLDIGRPKDFSGRRLSLDFHSGNR